MSTQHHIGIDPGKGGALAIITVDAGQREQVLVYDTPLVGDDEYDPVMMADLLRPYADSGSVALEKVHAMPTQGVSSMFTMGLGLGLWLGVIATLKIRHELVTPQRWRKVMLQGLPKGRDEPDQAKRKKALKLASVQQAQRLAPHYARVFVGPKGGLLDGRAEAYLLAAYQRRGTL